MNISHALDGNVKKRGFNKAEWAEVRNPTLWQGGNINKLKFNTTRCAKKQIYKQASPLCNAIEMKEFNSDKRAHNFRRRTPDWWKIGSSTFSEQFLWKVIFVIYSHHIQLNLCVDFEYDMVLFEWNSDQQASAYAWRLVLELFSIQLLLLLIL